MGGARVVLRRDPEAGAVDGRPALVGDADGVQQEAEIRALPGGHVGGQGNEGRGHHGQGTARRGPGLSG